MMNPMQLMQMIRGGGNPQQAIINMMKQQSGNNPVIDNAINMMEKGDNAGIEKLARNLCKERNINLGQQDSTRSWQPNITITLADNTVYPLKGYVDFAEPQVDPQTGTFSVRAEMPNPKQVLLPGQFTKVKLLLDVREGALVVPMKAVTIEKGGAYIYTMRKDNAVEKRFIELGPEVGNNVVVERGLAEGEMVVVEGFHKLTPGMKVRVSDPEAEAGDSITTTKNEVTGVKENTTGTKDNAKGE